jgi:hypothetical protein
MLAGFASRPWDYCRAEQAVMWPMPRSLPKIAIWCLVRVGIWLARQDWVLLAAAAESDCRLVIWLLRFASSWGFRRVCHRMALAAVRRAVTCRWGVGCRAGLG